MLAKTVTALYQDDMKRTDGKKRVALTVNASNWENLMRLGKEAGMRNDWVSTEIDRFIPALIAVIDLAKKDAEEKRKMNELEAMARYGQILSQAMKDK
jgi:hypothetical protein